MPAAHTVSIFCFGEAEPTVSRAALTSEQLERVRDRLPDPNGVIEIDRGAIGTVLIPVRAVSAVYIHD